MAATGRPGQPPPIWMQSPRAPSRWVTARPGCMGTAMGPPSWIRALPRAWPPVPRAPLGAGSVRRWWRVCSRVSLISQPPTAVSITTPGRTVTPVPIPTWSKAAWRVPGDRALADRVAVVVVEDGPAGVGPQAPVAGMGDRPGRVDLVLLFEVPGQGRVGNPAAPQAGPVGADLVVGVEQGAAGQAGGNREAGLVHCHHPHQTDRVPSRRGYPGPEVLGRQLWRARGGW